MRWKQFAPGASLSFLAVLLCGCERGGAQQAGVAAPPPVQVQTAPPERRDLWMTLTLTADVMPLQEATLYAKTAGYLKLITKDKGDPVRRGELIAVIDAPELKNEAAQFAESTRSVASSSEATRLGHVRALDDVKEAEAGIRHAEAAAEEMHRMVVRSDAAIKSYEAAASKTQVDLAQHRAALARAQQELRKSEANQRECAEELRAAQAVLTNAQEEYKLARASFERYQQVQAKDRGLIAAQVVEDAESKMVTAQGRVTVAQGKVAALRHRVEATQSEVEAARQQIEVARGQLDSATRQIDIAKSNVELARAEKSVSEGKAATSQSQIEVTKRRAVALGRQAEVAKAQTTAAQASVGSARSAQARIASLAEYTEIRAPFEGVVTKRFVDVGALIPMATTSAQARSIVQIMDFRRVRVLAHVPEPHAPLIRVGMPVELSLDSLPGDRLEGTVTRTSSALDLGTRTLLAEIEIANPERKLLPGMFARVKFKLERHANALVVPTDGVLTEKSGKSVYVVVGGKAKKVPVQVGFEDATGVEILDGLTGKEAVVVVNKEQLVPDATVNAKAWTAPGKR